MRLDKYLCHAAALTRSRAQREIRIGRVKVDGEVIKRPDFKLLPDATVVWGEQEVNPLGKRYYMLYKPQNVVCATVDERHKTVLDLFAAEQAKGLHVAGRLDIDATGLVLLTDDGDWSHYITSPRHQCSKTYLVQLAEPLATDVAQRFAEGIALRNEKKKTRPAILEILSPTEARLSISEGKYHQVKRMFAAVGNRVVSLHRERIGALALDSTLQPGQWRPLREEEIVAMSRGEEGEC